MTLPLPTDQPVRWGILGCGRIADTVARDLALVPGQVITAVASATPGKAAAFAATHGVPVALGRYEDLVVRDDVDVVYIATTHELHHANARLALQHGKHVLGEKPLTLNGAQARELNALAQARGLFLMEALWTRFIPAVEALLAEIAAGVIGPVRLLQADFGVQQEWASDSRMVDPARAGGALLDLGIYPVSFAHLIFGAAPVTVTGILRPTAQGVDAQSSYLLAFPNGGQALLMSAVDVQVPHQARMYGPGGSIVVDDFFHPQSYRVEATDQPARTVNLPFPGRGYQFEIAEVAACLKAGRTNSLRRPMTDTLAVLDTLDALRATWGLRYPGE